MSVISSLKRLPLSCRAKYLHTSTRKSQVFTVTTPIFYCNAGTHIFKSESDFQHTVKKLIVGYDIISVCFFYFTLAPHIGHLYTALLADATARFQRLLGEENCKFVTGTDEHGTKIFRAAAANSMLPKEYCDKISAEYQLLFKESEISYTHFIRTTQDKHKDAVHCFWKLLCDRDFIYKGKYSGWYCVADEAFLTDSQVKDGQTSKGECIKVSTDSGQPVEWTTEENFMFRLSLFKEDLLHWLKQGGVVKPENFHRALVKWLVETELEDLSVSRPAIRVPWGVPVPGHSDHTVYVWLDALVNYLTAAGYPNSSNFSKSWPPTVQILGKDILKFHGIYWPAFLMAAGLEPPPLLLVHSHWTVDEEKMSKSRGNVIQPPSLSAGASIDELTAMRYFLLRTGTPHKDNNYSEELMIHEANTDLMGAVGNLLNRCTGVILNPQQEFPPFQDSFLLCDDCKKLMSATEALPDLVRNHYRDCNFYLGVIEILRVIDLANQYFTKMEPWRIPKDQLAKGFQNSILHVTMEALRVSGIALQPIIPSLASKLLSRLGIPEEHRMWSQMERMSWKGGSSSSGYKLGVGHIKLFEKIGDKTKTKSQREQTLGKAKKKN